MSDTEFVEFTAVYRTVFPPLGAAKDVDDMLAFWSRSLMEFTLVEAKTALADMAGDPSLKQSWRANHLGMLRGAVLKRRFERQRLEADELENQYSRTICKDCGGTGACVVPHPHCIVDDAWRYPYYTISVFCNCNRGTMRRQAAEVYLSTKHRKLKSPEGIGEYEFVHPNWKLLVTDRESKREGELAAAELARRADKSGPIDARKLASKIGRVPF